MHSSSISFGTLALTALSLCAAACASPERPNPGKSEYAGISAADWRAVVLESEFGSRFADKVALRVEETEPGERADLQLLALSGGGQNGALGAGILDAWPARPSFDVVTGVSTGALQATSAFLGDRELDQRVAELYSSMTDDQILSRRWAPRAVLSKSGMAEFDGLAKALQELLTREVIDRVGAEYASGRSLWVGTTNLDSGHFQPWNLTYIAHRARAGGEDYYDLYRRAVLASASVPGAVDPVYLNGYMHVDGGTRLNVFLPNVMDEVAGALEAGVLEIALYVIMNGKLEERSVKMDPGLMSITSRALIVAANQASVSSLLALRDMILTLLYEHPEIDPELVSLHLAYIPNDFREPGSDAIFDTEYMAELVEFGRAFAREDRWHHEAPRRIREREF